MRTFSEVAGDIGDEFVTVQNNPGSSDGSIVYNSSNGGLFYNTNGSDPGFGEGGQFATLAGSPDLTTDNFKLR